MGAWQCGGFCRWAAAILKTLVCANCTTHGYSMTRVLHIVCILSALRQCEVICAVAAWRLGAMYRSTAPHSEELEFNFFRNSKFTFSQGGIGHLCRFPFAERKIDMFQRFYRLKNSSALPSRVRSSCFSPFRIFTTIPSCIQSSVLSAKKFLLSRTPSHQLLLATDTFGETIFSVFFSVFSVDIPLKNENIFILGCL